MAERAGRTYLRATRSARLPSRAHGLSRVKSLADVAEQIEMSGASFAGFRAKNQQLWSALKTFVEPVSAVAQIATTPASVADFGIASSAVLGAVVYLIEGVPWGQQRLRLDRAGVPRAPGLLGAAGAVPGGPNRRPSAR